MTTPTPEAPRYGTPLAPVDFSESAFPRVVSAKATAASVLLASGTGIVIWADANETTGAAAFLAYLHDGTDASGDIIAALGAPASSPDSVAPAPPGIPFRRGLYLERVSGTFTAIVAYLPVNYQLPG